MVGLHFFPVSGFRPAILACTCMVGLHFFPVYNTKCLENHTLNVHFEMDDAATAAAEQQQSWPCKTLISHGCNG